MRQESDGGRHSYFTAGYCPDLVAPGSDVRLAVRVAQTDGPVAAGDSAQIVIELMYPARLDYSPLQVDSTFDILEGLRAVGSGTVVQMRSSTC